jgi:hypothetical protein
MPFPIVIWLRQNSSHPEIGRIRLDADVLVRLEVPEYRSLLECIKKPVKRLLFGVGKYDTS